jgi:hemolysin activation/secretion protein
MPYRIFSRTVWTCALAAVSCAAGTSVAAQSLPSREQIKLPPPPAPEINPGVTVEREGGRLAPCAFEGSELSVNIDTVTFTDASGAALPPEVAALLGNISPQDGPRSISQLCDLRDEAARRLNNAGYIAAVTIPEQEISNEVRNVRLAVILARLVDVQIVGEQGNQAGRIAARVERLKGLYPLRTSALERELLLASDNPGLEVRMNLVAAPGGQPGDVVGQLQIARKTFAVTANLNNLGSSALGREIGSVRAEFYGLTGLADTTFFGASTTFDFEEQWTVQGGHYFSFDSGLTFGGSLAYAESRPEIGLPVKANSLLGAVEAYFPLTRTVTSRGSLGGGLEIIEQDSVLSAGGVTVPVTRDKLRVAFAKLEGTKRQFAPDGRITSLFSGTLQLRKGLDIFDATERGTPDGLYFPSKLEGDPTALLLRGGYSVSQRFGDFALLTQLQGQYSGAPLLAFEEFSVGNYTIGRGYDPSATSGDSALGVRIQPSFVIGVGQSTVEPYGFVDAVRIWNEDTFTTEDGRSLSSAGLGARIYFANRFVLDAGWAHPFDRPLNMPGARRAPDRFLVSLSASFGPSAR